MALSNKEKQARRRERLRDAGLKKVELWLRPEDEPKARALEIESQSRVKNHS